MNPLQAIFNRAREEAGTIREDTLPTGPLVPLAQRFGLPMPAQVHYNPLRNVPVAGGLINTTINGPLHSLGLTNEAAGNVASTTAGELALLAALLQVKATQAGIASNNPAATASSQAALDAGPLHPGRALEALRTSADPETAWLAGGLDLAANPLNYVGGIGEAGRGIEAGAPAVGQAIKALAAAGEVSNRAGLLPLAAFPAVRRALTETPAFLRQATAAAPAAPAVTGALEQAARDIGAPTHGPEFQMPLPGTQAAPPAPPLAIPPPPLASGPRQLALGEQVAPFAAPPPALAAAGSNEQRVIGMAALKGGTPTLGEIQAELKVGANEALRLQDLAAGRSAPTPALSLAHPEALRSAIAALEANVTPAGTSATGVARLGAAADRGPLSLVPDAGRLDLAGTPYAGATQLPPPLGAVTPAEEAAAKLADYGPAHGLATDLPPQTAAPDFPALTGSRNDLLAGLSRTDLAKLVSTAYNDVPKAITNAFNARPDPVALAERAIERITTGGLSAKLAQRDPALAQFVAALPDPESAIAESAPGAALANVDIPPSLTDPAERAAWQAKYVGASQAGTDILAAGDRVAGGDLTQADLNAMSPQERMAALRRLAGGDIAAGGGGGGFGLLPARLGSTLAGAGIGTGLGGLAGGGLGLATGHRGDQLKQDIMAGAGLGALAGGNAGALGAGRLVAPFADTVDAALRVAVNDLKLANTDAAGNIKLVAGNSAGEIVKQMNPFSGAAQRAEKKTFPGALPRNALGTAANLLMNDHASGVPLMVQNVKAGLAQLPQVATALEAAGRDPMAIAAAYEQMRSPTLKALAGGDALREREILAAGGEAYHLQDLGQMGVPALTGAVKFGGAGLASIRGLLLAPVTIGTGVARGLAAPAIGSAHRLGVGVIENGGRDAVVELTTAARLQEAVPRILAAAQARGINPATLGPDIGAGILQGRTADPVFNQFYDTIFADATKAGGAEARATLGNYDRKTGLSAGVMKVAGVLFPGIDWNVEQAKILARGAAKHPLIARHVAEIAAAPNPQDPQHRGQVGIGGPVGALLSGQTGGTYYVNPAYPFSPVGGELLNLPRDLDPALHPGMLPYDRASKIASAFGAGINPALQIAAYETGNTDTAPTSADRLLPAEQAADTALMRAVPGYNRLVAANPIAIALENAHAAETGGQPIDRGDMQARIEQGRYVDPAVQRAGAALVLQQTGLPIGAKANQRYLADLGDPNSALYRQAEARTLGGQALTSLANFVAPASGTAQTGTEAQRTAIEATLQNAQDPRTQAILAQYGLPAGTAIPTNQAQMGAYAAAHGEAAAARMQLVVDQIGRAYPVLRVDMGTTDKERQALLQQQWEYDHQTAMRLAPQYMQLQELAYLQRAGLLPPGALAGQQRTQDLRTLPSRPLLPLGQQGPLAR